MAPYRARTWRFDVTIELPTLSDRDEVCNVMRSILDEAHSKIAILGLDQSSFSYNVPEDRGLAKVSGYLHAKADIYQTTVKTWLCDARIRELAWTAILPGMNANWQQHDSIREILSANCVEDWKGLN